jgi:hypothetical protein
MENPNNPAAFKSQPWDLFDSIVARSFLMGDTVNGKAAGSEVPAISANGEMVFFQSSGRTRANMPWYTNLDVPGQLAYGLQVWQISVSINLPILPNRSSNNDPAIGTADVNGMVRLAESILNYSVLQLNLGQEDQIEWPLSRFPAGGGLVVSAATGGGVADAGLAATNNGMAQASNVLSLPEPIEMGRTQNLSAKIRLSPDVFAMIGSIAAPGVGAPLRPYLYAINIPGNDTIDAVLSMIPMMVQINLKGRRVKNTQYGQLVR